MLNQILWAYRNLPKGATKTTPFWLVYEHEVVLPVEINLQLVRLQIQNEFLTQDYWNLMFNEKWIGWRKVGCFGKCYTTKRECLDFFFIKRLSPKHSMYMIYFEKLLFPWIKIKKF